MDDLARSFLIALLLLAVFGVIGGGLMGRQALARVENINHSLRAIMSGDFSARIAPTSSQDELADLAAQINEMLARIETLMLAMREVTDNLAHDLRSPLTRLRGRLEKLSLSAQKTAQAEDIEQGLADIDQLLGLFTAVLNLSRMEAGTGDMQQELIGVKPLVDDVMELYQALFEEAGWTIDYAVDSAAAEAHILGDRHLLAQALINLLENALIHGVGSASHLTVSLTRRNQQIIISVTDTGGGVAEDQLAHIRQRFVRLDESRSRPGNGLGLSLVDAICRRHGGHLHLSNHRPSGLRCEMCLTARE
jgi:signal transduction histidine kinase